MNSLVERGRCAFETMQTLNALAPAALPARIAMLHDHPRPRLITQGRDGGHARRPGRPAWLLYIDGSHTYEGVTSDIDDWLRHAHPDPFVVFDDYADPEFEVRRAVDVAATDGRLRSVERLYGYAVARPGRS